MDLEIMAGVQEQIIGNCLCVLGDSMAMPIGSMIEKFRPEFERHMEDARRRNHIELNGVDPASLASDDHSGPMPTILESAPLAGHVIAVAPDTDPII
jgi:hypothetical protein